MYLSFPFHRVIHPSFLLTFSPTICVLYLQYFVFYEKFKVWSQEFLQQSTSSETSDANRSSTAELPLSFTILSSASAGAMASFLTSPLDMAKLRLQVQRKAESISSSKESTTTFKSNPTYRSMSDALVHSYRSGGVSGLFRGAGARVIHFVPLTTIIMTSYETCRNFINQTLVK